MSSALHLPLHRRPRSLADHLLRGLARAFVVGIAAEMAILVGTSSTHTVDPGSGTAAWSHTRQASSTVERLMQRYECSATGYAGGVSPRSSIVRTPSGRHRLVSFDRGWAAQTGDAPGTLVAVCLRPRR